MAIQAQLYSDGLGFPLCGSQDLVDNGCGFNEFCFNLQQKYQQQQQQQRNQSPFFDNSPLFSISKPNNINGNHQSMAFSRCLAAQAERQRQEIDGFICLQNERLRLALQEQRRQQLAVLLSKFESRTLSLLRQKDEEIAQAAKRTMELEDFLRKLEMENQAWQRAAKENEAMILSLNNTLEDLREKACGFFTNGVEDAQSCCDGNVGDREEETGESRGDGEGEEQRTRKMVCQSCHSRNSCVLLLPCRHLCSCKACEAFLDSCPVCKTVKKAAIEVLIF